MVWPQLVSERAPAGLQKHAQACLYTSHISSVVPVIKSLAPARDRVSLVMQPQLYPGLLLHYGVISALLYEGQ